MANFEAFRWNISSSINLLFLKSGAGITFSKNLKKVILFKNNFVLFYYIVPHIKIEPSSYLDVDLVLGPLEEKLTNGYYDDEWIVDASGNL